MPSVEEVLRQSGLSDEQIKALDAKIISGFTGVLSAAESDRQAAAQARESAEIAKRSNEKFYDETIAPSLNNWATEKANLEAQAAFYRTQNEVARAGGFQFVEAPGQPRNDQGRYVAGAPGSTRGSPTFTMEAIDQRLGNGISNALWALQEHQRLTSGQFLPDPVDKLAQEADAQRLPFRDYVARKYDFQGKQAALQQKSQEEHDNKIRQQVQAERDRHWAEKIGSNPDIRIAQSSRFADVAKAVKAGARPRPIHGVHSLVSPDKNQR